MFADTDLLPLSALQHFLFCRRQCALIHLEQSWVENVYTAEGRVLHEHAHEEGGQTAGYIRIERGLAIVSKRLGLSGKADIVEFHRGNDGTVTPFPVEYKRGRQKPNDCDNVQLCAQAICLEEMLHVTIPCGALFYGKARRRQEVPFTAGLRRATEDTARQLHELMASGMTPGAEYGEKCESCSLLHLCLPKMLRSRKTVSDYFREAFTNL